MRLTKRQIEAIHSATLEAFASRLAAKIHTVHGGDIDLLLDLPGSRTQRFSLRGCPHRCRAP